MALMKGEGTHQILYGGADIFSGLSHNRGYLARPDHAGEFPTVLLVHGAAGITASVKSVARRLARHGLAVVGPDLFRGSRPSGGPAPAWPEAGAVASDLSDAMHWMASPDTAWVRSGVIGLLALDQAASSSIQFARDQDGVGSIALVAPVFGEEIPVPAIPILGLAGKDDPEFTPARRLDARERLGHGEWVLYGGVGSGLLDESAGDYLWEVAEDIIERLVRFFSGVPAI